MDKIRRIPLPIFFVVIFFPLTATAQEQPPRFEFGPVFNYLRVPDSPPINAQNQVEVGGRFSFNLNRSVSVEAETGGSPFRTTNLTTAYQGGHLLQSFVGIKAGKRWDRFGVFGKFRPGLTSYSEALKEFTQAGAFKVGRRTDPAFDVGGALEFYVSHRVLVRYDLGDTIIHYNSKSVIISGQRVPAPSTVKNNFQFSTSIGFRF